MGAPAASMMTFMGKTLNRSSHREEASRLSSARPAPAGGASTSCVSKLKPQSHQRDLAAYDSPTSDSLYVTWVIEPNERTRQGIAKFLTRIYGPVMNRTLPASGDTSDVPEVMVDLPGS